MPTRKWFATQITALTGWAIAFVNVHGHWTDTIIIALITIASQALIGWLIPNDPTPGGIPVAKANQKGYTAIELLVGLVVVLACLVVIVKLLALL